MKEFLGIFKATKGTLSSKRVCGVLGWLVILVCYGYCCFMGKDMPAMGELIAGAVALLGVDSVVNVFKRNDGDN